MASRKRVGVIGNPVEHSLSPVFQQAAFDHAGIAATYERWLTTDEELPARINGLRAPDAIGANVTVPHKVAVAELVDELGDTARRIGAANTVINRDGHLIGENTDTYGFHRALVTARPAAERDRVLVIGAGGAARAVVAALGDIGVAGITVANRSPENARSMLRAIGLEGAQVIPLVDWDLMGAIRDHSVIVNATSIGWNDDTEVLAPALLDAVDRDGLVADLTYRPTPLLRGAAARGIPTMDGLPMLIYQGARSFELWTGLEAPTELMFAAVRQRQAEQE
ncbi:MAG: shikimate dehydrogenase [Chloroflexota bacterium]|nr:shikimate dehydrogenase [Chloroflexota bacterium]